MKKAVTSIYEIVLHTVHPSITCHFKPSLIIVSHNQYSLLTVYDLQLNKANFFSLFDLLEHQPKLRQN